MPSFVLALDHVCATGTGSLGRRLLSIAGFGPLKGVKDRYTHFSRVNDEVCNCGFIAEPEEERTRDR